MVEDLRYIAFEAVLKFVMRRRREGPPALVCTFKEGFEEETNCAKADASERLIRLPFLKTGNGPARNASLYSFQVMTVWLREFN